MTAHAIAASAFLSTRQIDHLLAVWGYPVVFLLVAVESLGVPCPGETALISAAAYAGTTHHLSIAGVVAVAAAGAIIGDSAGFWIGRWGGRRLLVRYGRCVRLTERRLALGQSLFTRHGPVLVFVGRFITGLRTWTAVLAGTMRMPWRRFLIFNVSGGVAWALLYGLGSYYLGPTLWRAGTGVDIALGVFAVAWIVLLGLLVRRAEKRARADQAGRPDGAMAYQSPPSISSASP
ncbi:MAG TPA: DedA family protein [Solirubrobacteraceae bacterium]|jgi:membrane protein DedA with SNARE-associated domain|nr:DedA family protein [Solirubrobacteraceae bacterium]